MIPRRRKPLPLPPLNQPFVAIDFETADHSADSACAIGLVRVEDLKIVAREKVLIRPPREHIVFSFLHGLTWPMLKDAPLFKEAWPALAVMLEGTAYLAAHNASFDRGVLTACCLAAELAAPGQPFVCTVQLAKRQWGMKPANLPAVCRRLGIGLIHHDPLSDAEACARIVIAAARTTEVV